MLPPVMLPVAVINPPVLILPPTTFPAELNNVAAKMLPPPMLPVVVEMLPVTVADPSIVSDPPLVVTIAPPTVSALAAKSNIKPVSPVKMPLLLNST